MAERAAMTVRRVNEGARFAMAKGVWRHVDEIERLPVWITLYESLAKKRPAIYGPDLEALRALAEKGGA